MDTKPPTGDPHFHIRRSYELEAAGLTENSIKELQIALALDPENGEARLNHAVALGRKGLLLEAIDEANQVPESDSRRYDALALIGTLRRYLGDITSGRNLKDLLVADGDAEEMRSLYPSSLEERLLRQYFTEAKIDQPLAFTNAVLNLIFRKPE
jgi:tetratricopeptide (TPR) repeat protein